MPNPALFTSSDRRGSAASRAATAIDFRKARQVGSKRLGGNLVVPGELGRKLLQPVEAAGDQEQVIPLSGKLAGE